MCPCRQHDDVVIKTSRGAETRRAELAATSKNGPRAPQHSPRIPSAFILHPSSFILSGQPFPGMRALCGRSGKKSKIKMKMKITKKIMSKRKSKIRIL
jgi:hypothetical protein